MKLAVLGGGGVRSAFLAKSLTLYAKELNIDTIVFMDSNKDKLSIFGEVSKEVSKSINSSINFKTTLSVEEAVEGADYIITTIRVGEDLARIKDETIPLELGILGQETTGAGGFAMAMRSVAVLLEYSKIIEKKANKNAVTFNFTNPAALVTQALSYAGVERNFGICDGPAGQIHEIKQLLGYGENDSFEAECYGLNHLSWFKNFKANGKDVNDLVLKNQVQTLESYKDGASTRLLTKMVENDFKLNNYDLIHSLGHGVGLEIHEPPYVSYSSDTQLRENMVVTDEPGIYIPGKFGVRIEDTVQITKFGCISLTKSEKNYIII